METILQILVVLLCARLFGVGARRIGQPASVGELLAGVALAALVGLLSQDVPALGLLPQSAALEHVAQAGIFFLVLLAGIEMEPTEIAQSSKGALAIATGGMLVPLAAGIGIGWLVLPASELKPALTLVIGVSMAITAIPATVKVLSELDLLHRPVGEMVVSAALFDDVFGLFLLAVLTTLVQTGEVPALWPLVWLLLKVAGFFALTVALGAHVYPRISRRIQKVEADVLELSVVVGIGLAYGAMAEFLGMHWVLGAFMAGLYFERSRVGRRAYDDLKTMLTVLTSGLLGPMFFVWIGLQVDLAALPAAPGLLAALVLAAFLGKLLGAGLPARGLGFAPREALIIGAGMSARGEMELIILSVVLEAGLFARADAVSPVTAYLFSALVIMALVTTLLTPIVLRWLIRPAPPARRAG